MFTRVSLLDHLAQAFRPILGEVERSVLQSRLLPQEESKVGRQLVCRDHSWNADIQSVSVVSEPSVREM